MTNATQSAQEGLRLVGWMPSDDNRGTLSIIASSIFTIVICTWTAIHPRIHVSRRLRHTHKFYQLVKAILAPEMVCLESIQEYIQARKALRRCAEATGGQFKLIHGFYLSMLGVRYRCGDEGHRVLWPGQYAWLLNNGLVPWENRADWGLDQMDIEDKNKADGLIKLAALLQVIWFTLQSVTRAAHNLPLATLETMVLAYVFNAIVTYGFWWKKPKDIATATFIELPELTEEQRAIFENLSMENTYDVLDPDLPTDLNTAWYVVARDCKDDEVLVMDQESKSEKAQPAVSAAEAGDAAKLQISTSQISTSQVSSSQMSSSQVSLTPSSVSVEPSDKQVITEWDASLYMTKWWPLLCLLGASFGAIHLLSWSSVFPTVVEQWLWRSSALISVLTAVLCMQFRKMSLRWEGPLTIIKVGSPLLYVVSRFIMAGQTFAGLRAMEIGTYQTYEIWNYWFHFL